MIPLTGASVENVLATIVSYPKRLDAVGEVTLSSVAEDAALGEYVSKTLWESLRWLAD